MKKLYVFADFDWLKKPRLIGELSYESLRGSDSYGFCYSDEWLKDYGDLFLSDDLNNDRKREFEPDTYTSTFLMCVKLRITSTNSSTNCTSSKTI